MSRVNASGVRRILAAIVAGGFVALVAAGEGTATAHERACGTVRAGGSVWRVESTGVSCGLARPVARRLAVQRPFGYGASLLRRPPRGFDCVGIPDATGRQEEGYCTRLGGDGFSWERRA